jgi:hypothetical protein
VGRRAAGQKAERRIRPGRLRGPLFPVGPDAFHPPENAPFLEFAPESEEEYPEVILEELPAAAYSQEAIEAQVPDDYGPQRWLILNDEEWERLREAGKPEELELFLYLTEEQARVLETSPPGAARPPWRSITCSSRNWPGSENCF